MRESPRENGTSRAAGIGTSVAVYGDVSRADHVIVRGPAERVDLLAVYVVAGRVVAAVCIGQTARIERLVERAVAEGSIPVSNIADPSIPLDDAFFSPPVTRAA